MLLICHNSILAYNINLFLEKKDTLGYTIWHIIYSFFTACYGSQKFNVVVDLVKVLKKMLG